MGHLRLGRLPKTRRWREVVELLDSSPADPGAVARAAALAAEDRLRALARDPSLTYCFWLLTRIAWASRTPAFAEELADLQIALAPEESVLTFISKITDRVRSELSEHPESGPFSELASLALRRTLTETIGQQGPSLFDSSLEDLQHAFRGYSTRDGFGSLARRFFGDFLARTLRYFVDRELPNHVGVSAGLSGVAEGIEFKEALDLYARQSARILEEFAAGWYSKHNWQSAGRISVDEARGFTAVALRKLRMELLQGDGG